MLSVFISAEMNSDFCYSNIVASFMIEYQTIGAHTEMNASVPCTHTHKVVVAGDTHNLQRTFFSPTILKYSITGLLKGLDLLELAILYDQDT